MNTWMTTKFHSYSKSLSKITVRFVSQQLLRSQYVIPLQAVRKSFYKDLLSEISLPHLRPFKSDGLLSFSLFLTNYYCKMFWITSSTNRTIFRSLFEDTKITTKFPKRHIYNTSCIEINTLFAIFINKGLANFKVRPNYNILKGMDADWSKVFSSITQNYIRNYKSETFQKIPAPKKITQLK